MQEIATLWAIIVGFGFACLLCWITLKAIWRVLRWLPGACFGAAVWSTRLVASSVTEPEDQKKQAMEAIRAEYERKLEMLDEAGLTPHELGAAKGHAKRLFLNRINSEVLK